jgi:hypothetical protein
MSRWPTCALCGKEIFEDDLRLMNKQVVGWERPRLKGTKTQGGLNTLRIKRETGAVAHDSCVDTGNRKHKQGLSVDQAGLF